MMFSAFMSDPTASYMVIEGSPGTGKSHLTRELITTVKAEQRLIALVMGVPPEDFEIHVTATTNDAASVLGALTDHDCKTIFSLIGVAPYVDYKTGEQKLRQKRNVNIPNNSLIIIDEAGYLSVEMLDFIHLNCKGCKILLIGDPDQLAPVGLHSCPAFELTYPNVYKAKLTDQVRMPGVIAELASKFAQVIHGGDMPEIVPDNVSIFKMNGPDFQKHLENNYSTVYIRAGITTEIASKVRTLAATNITVTSYNTHIRGVLGMPAELVAGELLRSNSFLPNHKIKNNQVVRISSIGPGTQRHGVLGNMVTVNQSQIFVAKDPNDMLRKTSQYKKSSRWREYYEILENWGDFRPLFANTVHKSQGSTYEDVYINLNDLAMYKNMANALDVEALARLLNVATSRASKRVFFYGELPVIPKAS
jgi:hypothetical protein